MKYVLSSLWDWLIVVLAILLLTVLAVGCNVRITSHKEKFYNVNKQYTCKTSYLTACGLVLEDCHDGKNRYCMHNITVEESN